MPEKEERAAPDSSPPPKYRRPSPDEVRAAARRALRRNRASIDSQAALHRALVPLLRTHDPLFALGARRMRLLLVGTPGVRLEVRYTERKTRAPLQRCPVCGAPLRPIRNATLLGDEVTLGYRCRRCAYWTHLHRRVPVRYLFAAAGVDGERVFPSP
ncbi:MAG TPA: hypothetical protein VJS68_00640 [Thermoplasmata archaeon]|nr:hypothetical protein [Thermoplasmata archaeon]